MDNWPFGDLGLFRYDTIVADPPWNFDLYNQQSGCHKGAAHHYQTMDLQDIMRLPVGNLARADCLLFLWTPACMIPQALQVMKAWGFTFKSEMVWRKVYRSGKPRTGTGYRVRTMHEPILLGTIGNPQHTAFPSLFDGVVREHSRKPDEFYRLIMKHKQSDLWRCDLYARERRLGFDGWGDELWPIDECGMYAGVPQFDEAAG